MSRGRSSSGGGSRGSSSSGGRGMSRSSYNRGSHRSGRSGRYSNTTVFIGGGHSHGGPAGPGHLIFMAVIFLLFGIGFFIFGVSLAVQSFRYAPVDARCVDNDLVGGWYYTTYEYNVDGYDYTSTSNEGWEKPEVIDRVVTIYYLKSNPYEITEERPGNGGGVVVAIFALVFVAAGGLLIWQAVKHKKPNKQLADGTLTIKEETHTRCPYCGSKYNKNSDSCPKCGAGKTD